MTNFVTSYTMILFLICITFANLIIIEACVLPTNFDYGTLTILNQPNQNISDTQIEIICNEGFKAFPSTIASCQDIVEGKANCLKTCPPIQATGNGVQVNCQFGGNQTSCENLYAGTTVIFECDDLYENRNKDVRRVFVCNFGYWDFDPQYQCQPVCGKKFVEATKFIIGGEDTIENEYVWHIAVYYTKNLYQQICGGTIITPKISLSAAHCFDKYKTAADAPSYIVGAGKTYRNYYDSRDNQNAVQYRNISSIVLPEYYSFDADSRCDYDFAILILDIPFAMTSYVLPACLDQNVLFNHDNLVNTDGTVVGWGLTEGDGNPSEHLKMLNVNYVKRGECKLRSDFKRYYYPFVQDKICAGLYKQGKSACKGDSGGGLVFPGDDERYYIRGIVSIAPKLKAASCDADQFTLYTSVAFHLDFINEQIKKHNKREVNDGGYKEVEKIKPYENGCIIPKIENGRIIHRYRGFFAASDIKSFDIGTPVPNDTTFFYDCANGFLTPDGSLSSTKCTNGKWTKTECIHTCFNYNQHINQNYECHYNNEIVDCNEAYEGTLMKITCHKNYIYDYDVITPFAYCIDGQWTVYQNAFCVTPCGLDFVHERRDIAAREGCTTSREFPWHAGIYNKHNFRYICSGVYIDGNTVMTATSCLQSYSAQDLIVIVGKTYFDYHKENDGEFVQVNLFNSGDYLSTVNDNTIPPSVTFINISEYRNISSGPPSIHRACQGKFDFKYDRPGFFVSWEDPHSLDKYYAQLYKIQVIIRAPEVCNTTRADGVCLEVVGKPICQRVTGGAIVYKDDNNRFNVIALAERSPPKGSECNLKYFTVGVLL